MGPPKAEQGDIVAISVSIYLYLHLFQFFLDWLAIQRKIAKYYFAIATGD